LSKCPGSTSLKILRGTALLHVGKVEDALTLANSVVAEAGEGGGGSEMSSVLLLRAQCLNAQGNGASAIKTLNECLRQDPDSSAAARLIKIIKKGEALKKEGNDAFAENKLDAALAAYRAALELDPSNHFLNSRLHTNIAVALNKQGKSSEAVCECNTAIEKDEGYVKAYFRRAQAYQKMGDADSVGNAIRDFNKCKELLGAAPGPSGASRSAMAQNAALSPENKEFLKQVESALKDAQKAMKKAKFKDYYKLLEIDKNADEEDIKKAYKKAALKWHPDRHSGGNEADQKKAEAMFKDVTEANTVLSNRQSRARYDNILEGGGEEFDPNEDANHGHGHSHGSPFGGGGGMSIPPEIIQCVLCFLATPREMVYPASLTLTCSRQHKKHPRAPLFANNRMMMGGMVRNKKCCSFHPNAPATLTHGNAAQPFLSFFCRWEGVGGFQECLLEVVCLEGGSGSKTRRHTIIFNIEP